MRRIFAICSVFALLMMLSVMASAQKANFAGTWELDKSKSQLPGRQAEMIQSVTWTVTQDANQLSRDQKMERNPNAAGPGAGGPPAGGPPPGGGGGGGRGGGMMGGGGPLTVKLDGSETKTENERGKSSAKATWQGSVLEIKTVGTFNTPNGEMTTTTTEKWELADGGKTLKVQRVSETPRGPQESTWVFTKK
ncbi:MAG TPA: hypothetical protein PLK30_15725 [Blastocatellia bacterium]|nr:hypothetical protein [Blastocatellia bacterium]